MKMIVAVLNARPGMRPQLIELLRAHRARTLTEPGCQLFEVLPLDDTPEGVHLAEVYASAEAHRSTTRWTICSAFSPSCRATARASAAMRW